jgi:nucleotide-binding universal stress UspA family protein
MAIVCATHFTDSSVEASAVATRLAKKIRLPLWLVNVMGGAAAAPSPKDEAARAALEAQAGRLRASGLDVQTVLLHGKLERALPEFCDFVDAELVVIGERQQPPFPLFATAAERLSSALPAPLLLVRSRKPFEAWASGTAYLRVLLATDQSWRPELARQWLVRLAEFGPLDVIAVHVWSEEDERARRNGGTFEGLSRLLRAETAAALVGLPPNVLSRVLLEHAPGDVGRALLRLAEEERTDLIALGTHRPKGLLARLRSVSHEVLVKGHVSVALVPAAPSPLDARRQRGGVERPAAPKLSPRAASP